MARPYSSAELKEAVTLRQAGYALSAITEKTNISAATLHRHFRTHSVGKGAITAEAIEAARQQLLDDADFVGNLKAQIASSILDDLNMSRAIKERAMLVLEELESEDIPAMIKARSLASVATAVKVSSDIQRRSLRLDDPSTLLQSDDLPQLTISLMSPEEIERAQHRFDDDLDNIDECIEAKVIED